MRITPIIAQVGMLAAAGASEIAGNVNSQLAGLVDGLRAVVPVISLGLFVFAGVIYAIGQVFDVSTRQKAQGWAMAMIVGGIIGILIVVLAPWLVNFLLSFGGS